MKGWFRLHRGILDWEHFTEPTVLSVWICLLACTRTKAATVRGIRVEQNEAYVSFRDLHEYTGLSINTIKAAIEKLVASGEIEKRPTSTGTIFKIVKFSHYQPSKSEPASNTPAEIQPQPIITSADGRFGYDLYGKFKNVELKPEELRKLQMDFGEAETQSAIEDLSCKLMDGSTESKAHYATLTYWLISRQKRAGQQQQKGKINAINEAFN